MLEPDFPKGFKAKGLVAFEEITDYSLITDSKLLKKLKRKNDVDDSKVDAKKAKVVKSTADTKKEKKKKMKKKSDETKKVKFNEEVTVLNKAEVEKEAEEMQQKPEKLKVKKEKKVKKNKKVKKPSKSNSTSRVSLNCMSETNKEFDEKDFEQKMTAWSDMYLPKNLLRGLYEKSFFEPMPIQKLVIPDAIRNRSNIVGTAQTGSGKTLAFGLPILTHLSDSYEASEEGEKIVCKFPQALILTPTRELAVQIKEHLQICCRHEKTKIVAVVGGISQQKQERLLRKSPEIVVATPGRLMQLIEEGNEYLSNIGKIRFLVVDEADRMIEKGHFGEMEKILAVLNSDEKLKMRRQNFLFSATLIGKASAENECSKSLADFEKESKEALRRLVEKIQMVREPKVFDLTTKAITADNLVESKIFCALNEKDVYLYYFACKYSGRTLVFSNSIDCVRRLTSIFRLLKKEPLQLHANMNQKQRLKNLEKFNAQENSLLIASDVASRGLDIPGVMHVIHYQVPRSAEIYIHRSGRTARSNKEGLSVMLVSPEEIHLYRKILATFKTEKEIKDYPTCIDYFNECKSRVNLAKKVDQLEHQTGKEKSDKNWFAKHAKMMDIELDDQIIKEGYVDMDESSKTKRQLQQLKGQLEASLKKMIFPRYTSRNYLQKGSVDKINHMNSTNENALTEFRESKKNKKKKKISVV